MATGDIIYGADYNAVQTKVRQILGDGFPFGPTGSGDLSFGYNQSLLSGTVAVRDPITKVQWQGLADDINKAYIHQNNNTFTNYATISGEISYTNLNDLNNVVTPMVTTQATRVTAHPNQLTKTQLTGLTNTRGSAWGGIGNVGITGAFTLEWSGVNNQNYFFNQGGSIQITGFGPNQSGSVQDSDWLTFLASFNCVIDYAKWSLVTAGSFTEIYRITDTGSASGNYVTNYIAVSAQKVNISGSSYLQVSVTYQDSHSPGGIGSAGGPGPDTVSAGAGYNVYLSNASGAFTGSNINSSNTTGTF